MTEADAIEAMARAGNFSNEPYLDTDTESTWYARVMLRVLLEGQYVLLRDQLEIMGGYDRTNPRYLYDEPAPWDVGVEPLFRLLPAETQETP